MGRALAAVALIVVSGFIAVAASADVTDALKPGDVLTYDLDVGLQVRMSPAPQSTQPPMSLASSAKGTETLTVRGREPDGSLDVGIAVDLTSNGAPGGSRSISQTMMVRMHPDGSMDPGPGANPALIEYAKAVGDAARFYHGRTLYVGETFKQSMTLPGAIPMTVTTVAKVVGEKNYRGYPTFAIQSSGNGTIDTAVTGARTNGTFDMAGTTYVDQRDKLLVGAAVRSNVNTLLAGAQGYHLSATATIDLALRSFTHQKLAPHPAATAAPALTPAPPPSAPVVATPAPSPTPTSGYYTPPPPSPSPGH